VKGVDAMTERAEVEERQDFDHRFTVVNDVRLHYVRAGEGKPILLISGFLQTWYAWRHVLPLLAKRGFDVIAVDPRGIGQSGRPLTGYDTGQVASDLHALMKELGHDNYSVIGHDVGVWIAYALARDYSEAVQCLVLVEAHLPGVAPAPEIFLPPKKNRARWHFMFNQLPDLPEMLIQGREEAYLSWMFEQWAFHLERVAVDSYIQAYSVPGAIRAGLAYYRALPETIAQNIRRAAQRLPMPVLAVGGEHAAADAQREMMESVTTNLTGVVIPGSGHFVPEEAPELLVNAFFAFVKD
jgi:pimeloyl-ACP methyl ester carboxylesterase